MAYKKRKKPHASSGPPVLVLLSGGIDSAATLHLYRRQAAEVSAVHVDYRQPARRSEWEAAQAIAAYYQVSITRLRLGIRPSIHGGEFFGRNALFALMAAATTGKGPLVIAAGLHAGSPYYDTTWLC
jgi:7-cyano-7-deazaguanine synthase